MAIGFTFYFSLFLMKNQERWLSFQETVGNRCGNIQTSIAKSAMDQKNKAGNVNNASMKRPVSFSAEEP